MFINATKKLRTILTVVVLMASIVIIGSRDMLHPISSAFAQRQQTFTATLSGNNEVPPIATTAKGEAGLNLSSDGSQITYRIQAMDPKGSFNVTMAHIHQGKAGNSGPPIASLTIIPCTIDFCGAPMYLRQGKLTASSLQGPLHGKPFRIWLSS